MKGHAKAGMYIVTLGGILFVLLFVYSYFLDKSPSSLSLEETNNYIYGISGYLLPESADVIYSRRFWGSGSKPLLVCAVFALSIDDFSAVKTYKFIEKNSFDRLSMHENKGCDEFRSKIKNARLFAEHMERGDHLRGYTVYLDDFNKQVMLEMYLYD
jgi:hypothetical protein